MGGFIGGNKTYDGVLAMARQALKINKKSWNLVKVEIEFFKFW